MTEQELIQKLNSLKNFKPDSHTAKRMKRLVFSQLPYSQLPLMTGGIVMALLLVFGIYTVISREVYLPKLVGKEAEATTIANKTSDTPNTQIAETLSKAEKGAKTIKNGLERAVKTSRATLAAKIASPNSRNASGNLIVALEQEIKALEERLNDSQELSDILVQAKEAYNNNDFLVAKTLVEKAKATLDRLSN